MRTYLTRLWRRERLRLYSRRYARYCKQVGPNFTVNGPCLMRVQGQFIVGNDVILDPTGGRIIEINVQPGATLKMGNEVYINYGVSITCAIRISIGNKCLIGPEVLIMDDDGHPTDWRIRYDYHPSGPETRVGGPIEIGDSVWLGARSIILKNVTIGSGSVVAAGAVVTHSVPFGVLVAGVPARIIRQL